MAITRLRDLIIIIPGISGSVLQKDGRDVWAPSIGAAWSAITSRGEALQRLTLAHDDPTVDDLGDGIRATALVPNATIIPGLMKIDGYTDLVGMVEECFDVRCGSPESKDPSNLIAFPYDWRRDNRYSARRLKRVVEQHLGRWREWSRAAEAKVVIIAHSMGGLVARYFLEVLEGWQDCRALITLGTPHRGSLNALNYLVNGYKQLFVDMTEATRSFTSMYQLLPTYRALTTGASPQRVVDVGGIPGLEHERVADGLLFHREIISAVDQHKSDLKYRALETGYQNLPVVGVRQPTMQSAALVGGRLTVTSDLPVGVDSLLAAGDGTVPRLSAVPVELSLDFRESFFPERHAALPRNVHVLAHLQSCLEQMQVVGLGALRGFAESPMAARQPAISLDLDDLYGPGEVVRFRSRLINASDRAGPPRARIESVAGGAPSTHVFHRDVDGEWILELEELLPGSYRIRVDAPDLDAAAPPAVHDLFEVV